MSEAVTENANEVGGDLFDACIVSEEEECAFDVGDNNSAAAEVKRAVRDGCLDCGRAVELDHHAERFQRADHRPGVVGQPEVAEHADPVGETGHHEGPVGQALRSRKIDVHVQRALDGLDAPTHESGRTDGRYPRASSPPRRTSATSALTRRTITPVGPSAEWAISRS